MWPCVCQGLRGLLLSWDLLEASDLFLLGLRWPPLDNLLLPSLPLPPEVELADSSGLYHEGSPSPGSPWKTKLRTKDKEEKKKTEIL